MANSIVKHKKEGSLIVISGPTSAGKGTICTELLKSHPEIYFSVSMTTREPRDKEVDGVHYFFVTKEKFEEKIEKEEFLEYAKVHHGNYYGTPKDVVSKKLKDGMDVILEIDIQGALQIDRTVNDAIFIFIMPPDMKTLLNRLEKRGTESKDKMIERIKTAYQEINEISTYNYVVVNDELDDAVKKVESIIISEKCRVDRIEDVDLGNQEEVLHELLMKE